MTPRGPQPIGIVELHRPTGLVDVDIVAIHGLNGDAIKTWTHESSNVCWLRDLLPTYINNARVLTWGYNANVNSLMGRSTSSDRILQHAQTLIEELQSDREFESAAERPIIFVCHSLGGIIVKKALAFSSRQTSHKNARLQSIYTCTYGIIFFGTPHSGSSKAGTLDAAQKLASLVVPRRAALFETSLLQALKEGSETLQNITDEFLPLMSRYCMFFLWEQLRTRLAYTEDYIVNVESAVPTIDGVDKCAIPADHRGMCKFQNASAPGFKTVLAALKRYSQAAPMVIQGRLKVEAEMLEGRRRHEAMELLRNI
ncbi:Alpha/Beta hydrolase protein [Aspergillus alliaceus]|uniref:Alpha/Beta hydrolase protein n=1 Tax=Petromyces alliaceus TaxID=209559 RepID=A0A5N7CN02_PETAA|nr:Alpha/Beta hydrolase protein [Aspergillus alliaceus]